MVSITETYSPVVKAIITSIIWQRSEPKTQSLNQMAAPKCRSIPDLLDPRACPLTSMWLIMSSPGRQTAVLWSLRTLKYSFQDQTQNHIIRTRTSDPGLFFFCQVLGFFSGVQISLQLTFKWWAPTWLSKFVFSVLKCLHSDCSPNYFHLFTPCTILSSHSKHPTNKRHCIFIGLGLKPLSVLFFIIFLLVYINYT